MKKTLLFTMFITAAAGAAIFAGGANDPTLPGRGYGMGFIDSDGVEIISLSGTVQTDSYGNLMIDKGKTNYLLAAAPTLGATLKEGDVVDGEGFEGNTLYTKDGESYQNFHLTKASINGKDYTIDLNNYCAPLGGAYGGMMYGGRNSRGGMMGYDNYGRGGMMGYGWNDQADTRDWGYMGRGVSPYVNEGEETTVKGTLSFLDGFHPFLQADEGNFLIRMGHWVMDGLTEGTEVEATGYAGPSLYTENGEDYYSFIPTSLTVNGEEVDTGYNNMPYGGGMGFGGGMGRRR